MLPLGRGECPTRLLLREVKVFRRHKKAIDFDVFEHMESDIVELLAYDAESGQDCNRLYFSKSALLSELNESIQRMYDDRITSLSVIREKTPDGSFELDNQLIRDGIAKRLIGEFIISHTNIASVTEDVINVEFDAPDTCFLELQVLKPEGLVDIEVEKELEENIHGISKLTSMKMTAERQRKVEASENVVSAFRTAVSRATSREYETDGAKGETAKFITPVKSRWQKSVKRIMLQNAVEKVSKLLEHDDSKMKIEPLRTLPALTDQREADPLVLQPVNAKPYPGRLQRKMIRSTLSALPTSPNPANFSGAFAKSPTGSVSFDSSAASPLTPRPTASSIRRTLKASRLQEMKRDSADIEREVAMSENVIEAFHSAVMSSLAGKDKDRNSSTYKVQPDVPQAPKARLKRSVKRAMLRKAVSEVTHLLSMSSAPVTPKTEDSDEVSGNIRNDAILPSAGESSSAPSIIYRRSAAVIHIPSDSEPQGEIANHEYGGGETDKDILSPDELKLFPII